MLCKILFLLNTFMNNYIHKIYLFLKDVYMTKAPKQFAHKGFFYTIYEVTEEDKTIFKVAKGSNVCATYEVSKEDLFDYKHDESIINPLDELFAIAESDVRLGVI